MAIFCQPEITRVVLPYLARRLDTALSFQPILVAWTTTWSAYMKLFKQELVSWQHGQIHSKLFVYIRAGIKLRTLSKLKGQDEIRSIYSMGLLYRGFFGYFQSV